MKLQTLVLLLALITLQLNCAQNSKPEDIPDDGKYTYDLAFAEWGGKSMGEKVIVIIKGKTIKVVYEGGGEMTSMKKGDMIEEGQIFKHKSGLWIISTEEKDQDAKEVGGCSDGPTVIDFEQKKFWMC